VPGIFGAQVEALEKSLIARSLTPILRKYVWLYVTVPFK
jgi:hypothetical protein